MPTSFHCRSYKGKCNHDLWNHRFELCMNSSIQYMSLASDFFHILYTWDSPTFLQVVVNSFILIGLYLPWGENTQFINPFSCIHLSSFQRGTSLVQFSSVAQSCRTLCDPINLNMPVFPVHHQLLESTQTNAHCVGDAIQPSHPLSSPSPPALNLSQHQGLFKWVSSSHQVAKILEFQLQHQALQWTPRTNLL